MTISKRVTEAMTKLIADDPESALFQICAAIEETAKREGAGKGRTAYKRWITKSIPVITAIGIGPPLKGINFGGFTHPSLIASDPLGPHSLEDIVYHVFRCGLYHEASLPETIVFTKNRFGTTTSGELLLSSFLILGLIVAVVVSPANSGETTKTDYYFDVENTRYYIDRLWGQRVQLLKSLNDFRKECQVN